MSILHTREFELAFPLNRQADISTAVGAAKINQKLPYRTFAPPTMENPDVVSDRQHYGKGHSHPTFWDPITERTVLASREYSMTQLSGLWAPAFVLGGLTSVQPDSANPTVYEHVLVFQDLASHKEALYTSLTEKAGNEYQHILEGACVNSFTLTGNRNDHVVIAWEGMARKRTVDATPLPALASGQSFFKILKGTFHFGAAGGGTEISCEVLNFNLTVSQNLQPLFLPSCEDPGEENLLSKVLIGDQTVSGQLRAFIDATRRDLFLNATECELTIVLTGDPIGMTGHYHTVTIEIPHFKIASESFEEEGQTMAYAFNFTEDSVLKHPVDPFIRYTVKTNIPDTDLLVVNP